ncbi:RICIN domain-containing protein [Streptomyces stelliscabiei]|uniref:RICIN domain-containing protein n=1 Tax=Streptomyces stelliscabiei TaxID=146820 RepID=UPI0029A8EDCF|nr:RICIN domain-containing protein [Streptomyces stelliscabiei]MDX2556500.1 RICIN domain-containing protein [Streptomyces stelliscabiei]MDX2615180.1 RICIN domain-containing protein [Streptomyces stelliscabiei]MDX2640215.1 RICIN domain-containing protein [Streptomyces stelliscabiei]MDX2665865.1 RICIN domain-containing protein [Streptomyces stelliscabiei]MDX2716924.1 RICIN domain-containing protein [Streptomyces stelliscabiei]
MPAIGQRRSTARSLLRGVATTLLPLTLIAGVSTLGVAPASAATPTLTVDLGNTTGAFRGGASGALYGLYGPDVPTNNLIEGMGLKTTNTKYQDGQQHPGSDALEIAEPFVDSGGGDVFIYMTDVYRANYERASYSAYQATMKTQVEQAMASPHADHIVFVPYNEPDLNWFSGMRTNSTALANFNAEWRQTYNFIKGIWPAARLAGPNTSSYTSSSLSGFLTYCKANNCLPDVVTWHTLGSPADVRSTVDSYRAAETAAGITSPITVNLNEYAHRYHLTDPGQMVQWIAAIEDEKIDGNLPYWNINGNLGDSAAAQNTPNAQWWLYNWYSSMSGNTVKVTGASNNAAYTLQGLASLDTAKKQARVILAGGGTSGASDTVIKNVDPAVFGSTVHVSVFQDRYSGYLGAAATPTRLSDADVAVGSDGTITLPITLDAMSAYQVIVSPGGTGSATASDSTWSATYEAENATLSGSGYNINTEGTTARVGSFLASGTKDVGGLRTGSTTVISFPVDVPTTGDYTLSVFGSSYAKDADVKGPTNVYARVDGGASTRIDIPVGFQWVVWGHDDATVHLTAGSHTITLATTGDNGAATVGDAIIDKIDLRYKDADVQGTTLYEAEQANLSDNGTAGYSAQGQSGAGAVNLTSGKSATFWVYSARDGYADLTTRFRNTGQADLKVNGKAADDQTLAGATTGAWSTSTNRVYLNGGVNKVRVTGTGGTLALDNLAVTPFSATSVVTTGNVVTYQAENGTLTGTAQTDTSYSQANGGVVKGIGDGTANSLTLDVNAPSAGTYAMTMRYANNEELPSNHYNPDLYAEHADVSVNGGNPTRVNFASTLHWNQFQNYTVPVTLTKGANTVRFTASQLFDWDGTTIGKVYSGGGSDIGQPMRSSSAPHLDQVSFAPASLHIGAPAGFSSAAVAQHSGLCLEDPGRSTANGTQYQQNTCGSGQEQLFDFHRVTGTTDTYTVVNQFSGKCLDVANVSTADGAAVQQWTCNGGANQRYKLQTVTALGNSHDYQLVAVHSGKCVDVSTISTAPGAKIHQWPCDAASALTTKKNQIWRLSGKD